MVTRLGRKLDDVLVINNDRWGIDKKESNPCSDIIEEIRGGRDGKRNYLGMIVYIVVNLRIFFTLSRVLRIR